MIKYLKRTIPAILVLTLLTGCEKKDIVMTPLASIKIVNAVSGGSPVLLGNYVIPVNNNQSSNFSLLVGRQDIYVWPVGDSLHPYYYNSKTTAIAENDIFTLFLSGIPESPEGILVKENLPDRTDSTAGIRFINLCPGNGAVNVTLATSPTVNEFSNIGYKGITDFKSFPASAVNTNYTFQVRDANDQNVILASFSLNSYRLNNQRFIPRFRNMTLVFNGIINGDPAPSIIRVNHYLDR